MLAYRVTERDIELIRITEAGELQRALERDGSEPAPPPGWLQMIIRVRRSIGDPVTGDFICADALPETAQPNTAFTLGDGVYWFYSAGAWKRYTLKFGDMYIRKLAEERGRLRAAIRLIDDLIAHIDPADYITSGNAGGQSVSFLSLAEVMEYYNLLRARLKEEEAEAAGMNSGIMLKTKPRPVGGVLEEFA